MNAVRVCRNRDERVPPDRGKWFGRYLADPEGDCWQDRPTDRVIRRYEREHPGDLVIIDIKKLGRIPSGGGLAHSRPRLRPAPGQQTGTAYRVRSDEWAYVRVYRSEPQHCRALAGWLHTYNHHRCHTAIGSNPPVTRVNNLPGHCT